jgi:hypothetical protein
MKTLGGKRALAGLALATMILSTNAALSATTKAVAKAPAAKTARISPVTLAHDGLVIPGAVGQGSRKLPFGTPRTKAIELVASKLGPAIKTGVYPECGDGKPLGYADFRGGIQLTFSNAKFVGWTLDAKGDTRHRMANGVGIGTNVATLQKLVPDVFIDPGEQENGGLGPGFQSDTWPSGWLDGARSNSKIVSLFAGKTCIVA